MSAPGPGDHRHVFGVRGDGTLDDLFHEHRRGLDNHEHVLRDGGTDVARTRWHDGEVSRTTVLGVEVDVEPAPIEPAPTHVLVTLRVSKADADTLREDWEYDKTAPLLSGGWQESPIAYEIVKEEADCG